MLLREYISRRCDFSCKKERESHVAYRQCFRKEVKNMSWIKNKLNKLLNKDEEQYEEYGEYEEYNRQELSTSQMNEPQQEASERKPSFRFPLIADEELTPRQPGTEKQPTYEEHVPQQETHSFALPRHLQSQQPTQVYDVEVSGIRELLERRQRGRGQSTVIRSNQDREREQIVTREERELLKEKPLRQERQVDKKFVSPLENRKRFVPTEVPSPVHGFNQVTPIEALLKQKEVGEPIADVRQERKELRNVQEIEQTKIVPLVAAQEEAVLEQAKEIAQVITDKEQEVEEKQSVQEPLHVVEEPIAHEAALQMVTEDVPSSAASEQMELSSHEEEQIVQQVSVTVEEKEAEATEVQGSEPQPIRLLLEEDGQEPLVEQPLQGKPEQEESKVEPMQVKHVTIENSTIHIEQLHVEQMPPAEIIHATITEPAEVVETTEERPKNEGTRLPFNVLMLKTDKQKLLAQQIAKEQFRKVKLQQEEVASTVVEAVEEQAVIPQQQETAVTVKLEPVAEHVEKIVEEPIKSALTIAPQQADVEALHADTATVQREDVIEAGELPREQVRQAVEEPAQTEQLTFVEEVQEQANQEEVKPVQEIPAAEAELVVPEKKRQPYHKPSMDFLLPAEEELEDREWMEEQGENLVEALSHFQIAAQIESIVQGPAVTQFEITVGHGTKVSKVRNLSDDIKLALAAKDVRIDAPIPGKRSIGIEIPNRISRAVRLSEVTSSEEFQQSDSPLEAALGLDLTGKPVSIDLRKMPHGLVAGATGSGKSVCINSILVSLLYKADPSELKLMLIDPKMVELAPFNHIPHLVSPVITDVKAATAALKWAVDEMERRYQLFMHSGQRHITGYNKLCEQNKQYAQKLPYILIVIDELADLMMMAPQDVEDAICRIAQKARACGIHLIIATQRPSVDVITGLIKSNIPTRIAFAVSSQIDSRTILDGVGAERLLGRGDMLYMGNGMSAPVRIQGTFVTDEEIEEIIEYVRGQGEPDYLFEQEELLKKAEAVEEQDELFEEVCRYVYEQGSASTSAIQRRYHIGYNRAARLVDMLERHRFVSEQKGSKPRDVFITETDLVHHFGG